MFISINCIFINLKHVHKIAKKVTIIIVMSADQSIRLAIRVEQLGCH